MPFGTRLRLVTLFLFASTPAAFAQPTVNGRLLTSIQSGILSVTVQLQTNTGTDDLGSSTIRLGFNDAALNPASGRAFGSFRNRLDSTADYSFANFTTATDPEYRFAFVTYPLQDQVWLNIELPTDDAGTVVAAAPAWTDVATLRFAIVDPAQTSKNVFFTGSQELYDGNNATPWTNGTFTGADVQLPVELTSFTAAASNGGAALRWATASETNNAGWRVEARPAAEGGAWREVGFVEGARTTTERQTYTFDVPGLDPGRHAFRLRQLDLDGTATYSDEVEVAVAMTETARLVAGPNPARANVRLSVAVREAQPVKVEVYDALGRRVATPLDEALAGSQTKVVALETASWAAGTYVVRLSGANGLALQRVLRVVH